jgi:H/ACA ribonucleoprotein complex subunit 4
MTKEKIDFSRYMIIIDKPSGPTSFQISDFVRRALGLNKASHTGTLDPKVTGVLPVLLGRAAKLTGYFSKQDKEYVGTMKIHNQVSKEELEKSINEKFLGKISQLPPVKSRVKREFRERVVKEFRILEEGENNEYLFRVKCQAGTYIRKLIHDLGIALETGAHMTELRRTKASVFSEEDKEFADMYKFTEAAEEYKKGNSDKIKSLLIPIEIIEKIIQRSDIEDKETINKLLHGSPFFKRYFEKINQKDIGFEKEKNIAIFNKGKLAEIIKIEKSKEEIKAAEGNDIIATPATIFN